MAGKKNGGEIEFDLDNFDDLDWPDFDFEDQFKEPVDDRNPVTKVAVTSLKAAGKTVIDPSRVKNVLSKTLPGAYSDVAGVGFQAADEMRGIFEAGASEIEKTKKDLQSTLRRTLPKVRGKLPDKLGEVLDKLSGEDDYFGPTKSKEQQRDETVQTKLDEILGAQAAQSKEEKERGEAIRLGNEVVSRNRFRSQMAAFESLDVSLRQIRDYNEGIDARWKRKTLELQMHQNYLLGDLVENTGKNNADILSQLAAIAKNTGLPEASKIVASEEFKRLNQARLLEHLGQGLYGNLGEYLTRSAKGVRERMMRTVGDKLRDFRSGVRDAGDMVGDMVQMQQEMGDQGDSLGTLMELAMGAGSDWATKRWGDKAKSKLSGLEGFNSRQGLARNFFTNGAKWLDEQAGQRNTHDGMKGFFLDMGRSLLHSTRLDGAIRGEDIGKMDMPDNFNRQTNRSITEIIPGLIARVHHEIVKLRTGDESVPMIRYDLTTGTFTDSASMVKRVKNQLVREGQETYNRDALNKIIDTIDSEKKLNGDQREILTRHLAQLNMTNRSFDIRGLVGGKLIHGPGAAADKAAIRQFLAERYGVNLDGSLRGSKEDLHNKEADIGQMMMAVQRNFVDPTGPIKALIDAGYREELLAAGILKNNNGSLSIDFDKVTDMRLGADTLGKDYEGKAYSPTRGNRPVPGGPGHPLSRQERKRQRRRGGLPDPLPLPPAVGDGTPAPLPGIRFDYEAMGTAVANAFKAIQPQVSQDAKSDGGAETLSRMDQILLELKGLNKNETAEYQTLVLEEIMDILQDGRQNANVKMTEAMVFTSGARLETERDAWGRRAGKAKDYLGNKLSGLKTNVGNKLTWGKDKIWGGGKGIFDFGKKTTRFIDDYRDKVVDIYVSGWSKAALEARKLELGLYRDKATGKIIRRLSDITGEVEELMEDGTTRVVLTIEDIKKGLHDRLGRRVLLDGLKGLGDLAGKAKDRIFGGIMGFKDTVLGALGKVKDKVWGKLTGLHDVYVKGEKTPRLLKHILEAGGYYDKATGEVITRFSDIKGDIVDASGNLVLSLEDMRKGLYDQYGAPIRANWLLALNRLGRMGKRLRIAAKRTWRGVRSMGKALFKGLGGLAKWTGGLVSGVGQKISDFFTGEGENRDILSAQLEIQAAILEQVIQLNPKNKKRKLGDVDGDGLREGSWQDILKKREDKKKKGTEQKKEKDKEEKKDNLIQKLIAALAMGMGGIKSLFDKASDAVGLADMLDKAKDYMPDWEGGDSDDKDVKRRRRLRRRRFSNLRDKFSDVSDGARDRLNGVRENVGDRTGSARDKLKTRAENLRESAKKTDIRGKLDTAWENTKRFGKKHLPGSKVVGEVAGKAAPKVATRVASSWGKKALIGAGLVSLGLASAPVAAAAGTAIGVGEIAWEAYKWFKNDNALQRLRLAQYGYSGDDEDYAKQILAFEELVLKNTRVANGVVKSYPTKEDMYEALEILGHDPDDPDPAAMGAMGEWFNRRFTPVYMAWLQAMDGLKIAKDNLPKLDDNLSPENKVQLFKLVRGAGRSGWTASWAPIEDMVLLKQPEQVEAVAEEVKAELEKESPATKELMASAAPVLSTTSKASGDAQALPGARDVVARPIGAMDAASIRMHEVSEKAVQVAMGTMAGKVATATGKDKFSTDLYPKSTLDALRTIRMRCYGLLKLDFGVVNSLIYLEWAANQKTKVDSNGVGYYDGSLEELISRAGARFGVGQSGSDSYEHFKQWLNSRFLPVWTAYAASVQSGAGIANPLTAHDKLKADALHRAAEAMVSAGALWQERFVSVWSIPLHPVMGQVANMDSSTVADNMRALIDKVEKQELDEVAGKDGKVKNSSFSNSKGFFSGMGEGIKNFFGLGTNEKGEERKSWFSRMWGGDEKTTSPNPSAPSTGATDRYHSGKPGQYEAMAGGGVGVGANFDPRGGTHGNVNDLPMPAARKGFEAHKDLIAAAAKMTGFDPGVLAGLLATESNFDSSVRNNKSSATGLGQFIDDTWKYMVRKYGKYFGIKEGTSPNDPRANILMTAMYMRDNMDALKQKLGRDNFTDVDLYNAHFLGPGGYALMVKNPTKLAKDLLPDSARANPTIFYRGGKRDQPVTAQEVINIQSAKQVKNRNFYGPMMHAYLKAKGEKVDDNIFKQQQGVEAATGTMVAGGKQQAPTGDTAASVPSTGAPTSTQTVAQAPVVPGGPTTAEASPARQSLAPAPDTGSAQPSGDGAIGLVRKANAGGADIASAPTAAPMPVRAPRAPEPEAPKTVVLPDAQVQALERAIQAASQTKPTASSTGGGIDKLVDISAEQLAVLRQVLGAVENLTVVTAEAAKAPATRMPGPMSVKIPT